MLRQIQRACVRKRGVCFFDICGLQFEIVREVCCRLVLVLWFGDLLSLGAFATFGFDLWLFLWFVRNSYLVFSIHIWNLWIFSSLVLYLWIMRESYLGVFEIWNCESTSTPICIIQIWYNEICPSLPVDVGYCRTT